MGRGNLKEMERGQSGRETEKEAEALVYVMM